MAAVRRERAGGVSRLVFAGPDTQNRLDTGAVAALREALAEARDDAAVRVVVLAAEGPVWCAGADLAALAHDAAARREAVHGYADLLADLAACAVPVVAVVAGAVRGGGVGLLCAADLVVLGPAATLALPEARVGVWPMMVGALLPRVVPPRVAMELALTARTLDAPTAVALGLASRVAPDPEAEAAALVAELGKAAPGAVRRGRAAWALHAGHAPPDLRARLHALADALDELGDGEEAAAGVAAFFARRPPPWVA